MFLILEDEGARQIISFEIVQQVAIIAIGAVVVLSVSSFMLYTMWKVYFHEDALHSIEGDLLIQSKIKCTTAVAEQHMKRD